MLRALLARFVPFLNDDETDASEERTKDDGSGDRSDAAYRPMGLDDSVNFVYGVNSPAERELADVEDQAQRLDDERPDD